MLHSKILFDAGSDNFFVTWQLLQNEDENRSSALEGHKDRNKMSSFMSPCAREMHSVCCHDGKLFILGGRDGVGNIMSDVWMLQCVEVGDIPEENLISPPNLMENHTSELNKNEMDNQKGNENKHDNKNENEHKDKNEKITSVTASVDREGKVEKVKIGNIETKSTCIIEELDLSNSRSQLSSSNQKWEEKVTPHSVNISPKLNRKYKLIWQELPMLKLPAGRCAHTSVIVCGSIMIIGGVVEEIGITDSVIIMPYPVTFPLSFKPNSNYNSNSKSDKENELIKECSSTDMKSEGKGVTNKIWKNISSLINKSSDKNISKIIIGARFGHCVCVLSHALSSKLHDNTSSHHTTLSPNTNTNTNTNTTEHPSSVLIFGGVCAEKDFSDFVLLIIQ
jgi:Kelch motif